MAKSKRILKKLGKLTNNKKTGAAIINNLDDSLGLQLKRFYAANDDTAIEMFRMGASSNDVAKHFKGGEVHYSRSYLRELKQKALQAGSANVDDVIQNNNFGLLSGINTSTLDDAFDVAPRHNVGSAMRMGYNDVHINRGSTQMTDYNSFMDSFNKTTTTVSSAHMDALPSAHNPIKQKTGFARIVADARTRSQYDPNRGTKIGKKREIGYGPHKRTVYDGLVKPTGNTNPKSPTPPGANEKSLWKQFKDAKGPQMALGALGLGYIASQMSANRGQQSNAQLYGQQHGYY